MGDSAQELSTEAVGESDVLPAISDEAPDAESDVLTAIADEAPNAESDVLPAIPDEGSNAERDISYTDMRPDISEASVREALAALETAS